MSNIDRADWHYGADNFPAGLAPPQGGTHIGIYLAWIIRRGLGSDQLTEIAGQTLASLERRECTGRDLLFRELDEKFFSGLLSPEGLRFTEAYYESEDYFQDYVEVLGGELESAYEIADTWENYDALEPLLDERLRAWRSAQNA